MLSLCQLPPERRSAYRAAAAVRLAAWRGERAAFCPSRGQRAACRVYPWGCPTESPRRRHRG